MRLAVGVALFRPPRIDEFRLVQVEASTLNEARITACLIAACTSVMPVWVGFPEDVDDLPDSWFR